jgi:hypothetical protein
MLRAVTIVTGVTVDDIHSFTATRGSDAARTPRDSAGGRNLRAGTSRGPVTALDVFSTLLASPDNASGEPAGHPSKDELAEGVSVVFAFSIVPPRGRKSEYSYVLYNMKSWLETGVADGDFHYWLQQAALDDVYPDLLMGQITLESCTIIDPTYDDDGGDNGPAKTGLPLPALISIVVGVGAILIGAGVSLYCFSCRSPAGEWVPALKLLVRFLPHMRFLCCCTVASGVSEALPTQQINGRAAPGLNQVADLHGHFYGGLGAGQPGLRGGTVSQPPLAQVPAAPTTEVAHNSDMLTVAPSAPPSPAMVNNVVRPFAPSAPVMVPVPQSVPVPQLPVATVATPVPHGQYYGYASVAMAEVYVEERNV